jgi:nitrate reductase delta subunit
MLRPSHKLPDHVAALERVKGWTRERFRLARDATVFVSEVSCSLPGCPPLETVVAFWTGDDARHQFKIFKPVSETVVDDLPPAWLKEALIAMDGIDQDCC